MRETVSGTSSCVAQARYNYVEAEKSCRQEEKYSLYLAASKLYLQAAPTVSDPDLKRSLAFLSQTCAYKAAMSKQRPGASAPVVNSPASFSDTAVALHSQRLIHLAHMQQLERLQNVRIV
jgi:hypothetical protein